MRPMRLGMACLLASALLVSGCGGSSTPPPVAPTVTAVTPATGATNVAVNATITATFSEAMMSSSITASTFQLTGAAGAAVSGTVSYSNSVATFTPSASLAYSTQYTATINTGAFSSSGAALGANYSWTFTTAAAPVPPTVTAITPLSAATGVAIGTTVTATFSQAMNSSTITPATFTLTGPGTTPVSGTVTYTATGSVATFTPSANLAYSTQYTATITTGAQDSTGTPLAANYTWTFTTVAAAPTVTAVTPASAATGVSVSTTVTANFSEAMNSSTITSSTFTLTAAGGASVTGTVSYAATGSVATFAPNANLAYSTQYTATITTGAQSSSGPALAANYTWTFTTVAAPAPTVTSTTPANSAMGVSATAPIITAAFSQAMNPSTLTSSTFTLTAAGGAPVTGTVTYTATGSVATFAPSANLAYNTQYTATITTGAQSSAGAALAANYPWTFTTSAVPPTVLSVTPASAATGVAVTTTVTATFSQSMNPSTINSSTFTLAAAGGAAVTGTVTFAASTSVATFTPSASLAVSTQYTATITTGVQNAAGTALAANYTWSFTTAAANPNLETVDFTDTLQTIRGFGGSTAWLGQMPAAVAKALFSPTNGLGLSILRVRIDPTGTAANNWVTTNPSDGGNWLEEATNGGLAVLNNPNAIVFATPWTPPATWKLNGTNTTVGGVDYNETFNSSCSPANYCGGYLDPNHYSDYANYLEDFVTYFNSQNSFNLYAISMQNEPEENVSYESCVWTPAQMDAFIDSLTAGGATNPLTAKLIMPESDTFKTSYTNPIFTGSAVVDSAAYNNIGVIGGHIYGTTPFLYPQPSGVTQKEVWMTEFGPLSSAQLTWPQALTFAQSIHQAMTIAQYNAYVWWGIFGDSTGSCATAAGTCGLVDNSGNPSVVGYVMGQYSKFVQPGYSHVGVTASANESANVLVSAYTGTESGTQHYVIVAINMGTSAVTQAFAIQNGTVTSVTPYQSTSAAGLALQTGVSVTAGQFTYTLPAQSITTFVE